MIDYKETDINLQLAIRAHNGTSFVPEKRGQQYIKSYIEHMAEVIKEFEDYVTDENKENIINALQNYKAGYLKRLNAVLHAKSNCISTMIAGPSNFPVKRANKASESAHKRTGEYLDYIDWKLTKLRRQFNPRILANAPIRLDDNDAIKKLEKKITKLKRKQEAMKAINKIVRDKKKTDDEKIDEIINEIGFSEDTTRKLLDPNQHGGSGFASYSLTNNNANIKRLEGRLSQILREQSRKQPDKYDTPDGIEVIENTDETRIQIIFDGKPDYDTRTLLKKNGFRWSPAQGAWQRLLNANGRLAVKYVLGKISGQ